MRKMPLKKNILITVLTVLLCMYVNSQYLHLGSSSINENTSSPPQETPAETKIIDNEQAKQIRRLVMSADHKVLKFYHFLSKSESQTYSQNREDGVIEAIMNRLRQTRPGFYVEIGLVLEQESNTLLLKNKHNWTGLLLDDNLQNPKNNLQQEVVEHSIVNKLFEKYNVPKEFELLSIDEDYSDYWILEAILNGGYRPKVVVHEVNQQEPNMCVTVPKPAEYRKWDGLSSFHGGSVCAFRCLAKRFKYTMVYCESAGVNCFWIRNDLLEQKLGFGIESIQGMLTPQVLYKKLAFAYQSHSEVWEQVKCD